MQKNRDSSRSTSSTSRSRSTTGSTRPSTRALRSASMKHASCTNMKNSTGGDNTSCCCGGGGSVDDDGVDDDDATPMVDLCGGCGQRNVSWLKELDPRSKKDVHKHDGDDASCRATASCSATFLAYWPAVPSSSVLLSPPVGGGCCRRCCCSVWTMHCNPCSNFASRMAGRCGDDNGTVRADGSASVSYPSQPDDGGHGGHDDDVDGGRIDRVSMNECPYPRTTSSNRR